MKKRKQFLIYTLIFIPVFLGTFCGLYLNGKSFVWQGDGFRQYYPALQYLGRYYRTVISGMLHLDFSIPMMDYSIGQGEDIITTFCNYGLGDPFSLLAVFFTGKKSMELLYAVLVALRLYVSGIAFLCFANGKKWNKKDSLIGAFLYVFCGFALWSIKDPFFFEWNDLSAVCSSWNRADLAAKKTGGYDSCHMLLCFEWLLFLLYDRT